MWCICVFVYSLHHHPHHHHHRTEREQRTAALVFGLVNAIVGIPTMVSFAAIVYQVGWLVG